MRCWMRWHSNGGGTAMGGQATGLLVPGEMHLPRMGDHYVEDLKAVVN